MHFKPLVGLLALLALHSTQHALAAPDAETSPEFLTRLKEASNRVGEQSQLQAQPEALPQTGTPSAPSSEAAASTEVPSPSVEEETSSESDTAQSRSPLSGIAKAAIGIGASAASAELAMRFYQNTEAGQYNIWSKMMKNVTFAFEQDEQGRGTTYCFRLMDELALSTPKSLDEKFKLPEMADGKQVELAFLQSLDLHFLRQLLDEDFHPNGVAWIKSHFAQRFDEETGVQRPMVSVAQQEHYLYRVRKGLAGAIERVKSTLFGNPALSPLLPTEDYLGFVSDRQVEKMMERRNEIELIRQTNLILEREEAADMSERDIKLNNLESALTSPLDKVDQFMSHIIGGQHSQGATSSGATAHPTSAQRAAPVLRDFATVYASVEAGAPRLFTIEGRPDRLKKPFSSLEVLPSAYAKVPYKYGITGAADNTFQKYMR